MTIKVLIMGAAGRDFHNFNVCYRNDDLYRVVAFTATQIPDIAGRRYPPELAGPHYPDGIPIYEERELEAVIAREGVEQVVFSYSDVSNEYLMAAAARVAAAGPSFVLLGARRTMLKSKKPVVAVCAVRTGSGKSQTTRYVAETLAAAGKRVVVVRHPMPYGDLVKQTAQRFATYADLDAYECTIEEREEYEPHLDHNRVVFAGVDYGRILEQAEAEADVVLWDGGNNDTSFYAPDLYIVVADPLRAGHEVSYYHGQTNMRMADVIVINKIDSATPEQVRTVKANTARLNPRAVVVEAESPLTVTDAAAIKGKRVLCLEDGPTLTHGLMPYGAAVVAAKRFGAGELVDPRPYLVGSLVTTFQTYPHIGTLLPAMGYGGKMVHDLEATVNAIPADVILSGTPIDITRVIKVNKPVVRVDYDLKVVGATSLQDVLKARLGL
jgi:predicted GTPase